MKLRWSLRAQRDLKLIRNWVARNNPLAAERVVERVLYSAGRLEQFPGIGRATDLNGIRLLHISGLPYALPYRVTGEHIEVLAVFDQLRNPEDML